MSVSGGNTNFHNQYDREGSTSADDSWVDARSGSFSIPEVTNDSDTDGPILYTRKKMRMRMAIEALASKKGKGYSCNHLITNHLRKN